MLGRGDIHDLMYNPWNSGKFCTADWFMKAGSERVTDHLQPGLFQQGGMAEAFCRGKHGQEGGRCALWFNGGCGSRDRWVMSPANSLHYTNRQLMLVPWPNMCSARECQPPDEGGEAGDWSRIAGENRACSSLWKPCVSVLGRIFAAAEREIASEVGDVGASFQYANVPRIAV